MVSTKITSRDEFKALFKDSTYVDVAISLNHGAFSRKEMALNEDGSFWVMNCIDGTTLTLGEDELFDPLSEVHNIGKAFELGALFHLNYND
ncbi:MAG: hypothetical protein KBB46_03355 [Candidatus Pacebacteria bacterium]|nr:hypothetical protein [Candidatus Paceibacterota bacterium]